MSGGSPSHAARMSAPAPWPGRIADLLLASALLYGLLTAALRPFDALLQRSFDDAFYYSRIADNLARGLGSTFDGLHPTNGYQPLWQWLLVPIFSAKGWSLETLYRLQLAAQVPVLALAGLAVRRLLRTFVGGWPACAGMALFAFLVVHPCFNGMETALQVLALALLPAYAWQSRALAGGGTRAVFGLGMLIGLAMLARLDLVFLPLLLGIVAAAQWLAGRRPRGEVVRETVALMGGVALVMAPYLLWNRWAFGAAMPISGMLKTSFPVVHVVATPPARLGVRGMIHLVLAVAVMVVGALGVSREVADPARRFWHSVLAIAAGTMILHLTYSTLFMGWGVFRWHFLWYALVSSLVVPEGLRMVAAWLRSGSAAAARWSEVPAAALVVLVALAGTREVLVKDFAPLPYNWHEAAYDASLWTRAHLPPDAVMAMNDAGLFGYFSDRRVVNMDGVVNNLEYQRELKAGRLGAYLRQAGVRYVVKHDFGDVDWGGSVDIHAYQHTPYRVLSHLYNAWSDTLWLDRSRELWRSREFRDQGKNVVFAIWELEH